MIKPLAIRDVFPLAASFCGFVVLTNLSLTYNTVGFYQLTKVMTTPVLMLLQAFIYREGFPTKVKLAMLPVIVGVAMASKADVSTNFLGCVFAVAGVFVTALYQIVSNFHALTYV